MKPLKHIILACIFGTLIAVSSYFNFFYNINNIASDVIYQKPKTLDGTIYVLGIDERALGEIGPWQNWTRGDMADIVNALNKNPSAHPAVIGIDVMYFGKTNAKDDKKLVDAASKYGNVVIGSNAVFKDKVEIGKNGSFKIQDFNIENFEEPYPELKAVTKQGHVNNMPDIDGIMRSNTHILNLKDGRVSNSFAYEIYKLYAKQNELPEKISPPVNDRNQWYIPYSGLPGDYSDGFSVIDVLNGDISPEMFANSIVLIGPYATGMRDSYVSAIDHSQPMYGVEIHANIVQALLDNNFKVYASNGLQSIAFFFITVIAYFLFRKLKPQFSTPVAVVGIALYLLIAYLSGQNGILLKILYLPLGIAVLYFLWLAINYLHEILEKKKVTDTFKKYVAPTVVDEIIKSKNALKLGGEKREIACLFVDIRGFTPMSESLEPEQVVEILNQYLDLTSKAIFKHEGMLDKFIGDATMAIFNAPLDLDDYVYKAVLTAWDMIQGANELSEKLLKKYGKTVNFGIGINCGSAVVGNIGTDVRMDYTAIGDTVNTAARLESKAKPSQVLISEAVYETVKDRIEAMPLGEIPLKGKSKGVAVYGLSCIKEE